MRFCEDRRCRIPSLENLIYETYLPFWWYRLFYQQCRSITCRGLDEMDPEIFDFVTKINYNAYFYCAKVASKVMKLQTKYA